MSHPQPNARRHHRSVRVGAVGCCVGVVLSLSLSLMPASATAAGGTTSRWSGAVNTNSLAAVNSAYWTQYASNYSVSTGWLGSLLGCLLGQSSATSNRATLNSLNFVRSLAGLAPVKFSATMNRQAQAAALMMAANQSLSHTPPQSWLCYTLAGARAALRSNLALAFPQITSGQVVDLYMDDPGRNNTDVGHRRWVLNPFTTTMGNGSTTTTNALMVVGPTNRRRPNPTWVPWPSAGYFPGTLEPGGRWSLSAGKSGVNFRKAKVRVVHDGRAVPLRQYAVTRGYAARTIAWQLQPGVTRRGKFQVSVTGIRHDGSRRTFSHHYTVRLFTPTR